MNYKKTPYQIINDKVNKDNIDEVLNEIKSELLISINTDKEPYIKNITSDKVINITGESGSGKSYYTNKYHNDNNYIVIDTDLIFNNQTTQNKYILELREIFKDVKIDYLITNFDDCYKKILDTLKDTNKTIVIDSAQYRNIKDYYILKGKIIIMRTCINTCYNRCIDRWKKQNPNYTKEELEKYTNKKLGMYIWYKKLNNFLVNIDKI